VVSVRLWAARGAVPPRPAPGRRWSLSPAFDVVYAHNPSGRWTAQHQMSINGKRDRIAVENLRQVAAVASLMRGRAEAILAEVVEAVRAWPELAARAGVDDERITRIGRAHQLDMPRANA